MVLASAAQALPAGGAVAAGAASLTGGGNLLTVNQSSQNAVINWQSFNIAQRPKRSGSCSRTAVRSR